MAKTFAGSSNWASTTPSLSTRSLFLTITPTPRTMTARLSILRAVSAHGPVDHFRCLKHHPTSPQPNCFHTIVSSQESAERLLKSSPFSVDKDGRTRQAYADEIGIAQEAGEEENYTVEVRHSYHAPEVAVKSSPLYGGWKSALGKNGVANNPITLALKDRVPGSIAKEGICDWSRDSPRERRAWFTGEGGSDDVTPWRIQRRNKEEVVRNDVLRKYGNGGVRRSRRPVEGEDTWEEGDVVEQEGEERMEEPKGLKITRAHATALDVEMQRALRQVAYRFGPAANTLEQNSQEAEARRIEAERSAAVRAAAMERTRVRMGESFTSTPARTLREAARRGSTEPQSVQSQFVPAVAPVVKNVDMEEARKAMKEKKARYAAWHAKKEEMGQSLRHKSRTEKWKMFWDEVEHVRKA